MRSRRLVFLFALFALTSPLRARADFVLAAEDDWYPYSGSTDSVARGFVVELISAAYRAAGSSVAYKVVPFSRVMAGVKSGAYVGGFNAGVDEALRADCLLPRQSLATSYQIVWGLSSAPPVKSYADLEGKRVGIVNAYTYSPSLLRNDKIVKDVSQHDLGNLKKVAAGRIDCTIIDRWVAKYLISAHRKELGDKIRQVGVLQSAIIVPVFSKAHPEGAKAMAIYEKGMGIIKSNGTFDRIMDSWEAKFQEKREK